MLGRWSFAAGALEFTRPCLAPLFSWSSARGYTGYAALPWSVRFIFQLLFDFFSPSDCTEEVFPLSQDLGEAFRADARAEGRQ